MILRCRRDNERKGWPAAIDKKRRVAEVGTFPYVAPVEETRHAMDVGRSLQVAHGTGRRFSRHTRQKQGEPGGGMLAVKGR